MGAFYRCQGKLFQCHRLRRKSGAVCVDVSEGMLFTGCGFAAKNPLSNHLISSEFIHSLQCSLPIQVIREHAIITCSCMITFSFFNSYFQFQNSMHMFKHNLQQVCNYIAKECHLKINQNIYLNYHRMNCKNNNLTWLDICCFLIYLIYKICNLNVTLCQNLLLILEVYLYDE